MQEKKKLAIEVDNVQKIYKLYDKPSDRMKEAFGFGKKTKHKLHYALKGVDMKIYQGETVGIIGTNGSGKSTILKIITGVLNPTSGRVLVNGRISALLELGAGFNMEYNGIENVYLNGTMMGFSEKEIEAKLPEILSFADIGDYVYQPVKTYSSGMFVRLAFAVAINIEPEILIVDEALSVGDVFFQSKCYRRMEEIRKNGTTIIMVTHDMGSIIKYCDKVVLLNKGEFIAQGSAGKMVDLYKKILAGQMDALRAELEVMNDFSGDKVIKAEKSGAGSAENGASENEVGNNDAGNVNGSEAVDGTAENGVGSASDGTGNPTALNGETAKKPGLMRDKLTINANREEYGDGRAQIFDLGLVDARGNITNLLLKGEEFTIRERIRFNAPIQAPIFTYTIKDKKGTDLTGTNTLFEGTDVHPVKEGDIYDVAFTQKMTLQGGEYLLSMSCTGFEGGEHVVYHRLYDVANITVISNKNTVGVYDMEPDVAVRLSPAGEAAKQAESLSADEAAQEDLQA